MHNTSLSGLLRGAQSRHDDCGISWASHEPTRSNDDDNAKAIAHLEKLCHEKRRKDIEYIKRVAESAKFDPIHIIKWGYPPFQYRNPRIYGPVVDQDEMDQRNEWLDTIARESERLGLD